MTTLLILILLIHSSFGVFNKLLITTGYNGFNLNKSEIINLENPSKVCPAFEDFPLHVRAASGGLIAGSIPVVCGGYTAASLNPYSSLCYTLKHDLRGYLSRPRAYSASLVINDTSLWITGGLPEITQSTEIVSLVENKLTSETGPDLPMPLFGHCLVPIPDGNYMIIGGYTSDQTSLFDETDETFIFHAQNQSWTSGPSLNLGRYYHSCGVLDNTVVVVGGFKYYNALQTVELLDLSNPISWTEGPILPRPLIGTSLITLSDSLLVMGGGVYGFNVFYHEIYEFDLQEWNELPARLETERNMMVAMLVPDEIADC